MPYIMSKTALAGVLSLSLVAVGFTGGCLAESDEPSAEKSESSISQPIVKGIPSVVEQDATVLLLLDGALCTGTLIAPNLVLTARHCTDDSKASKEECRKLTKSVKPSSIGVVLGINATPESTVVARGIKIFDEGEQKLCSHDISLVQLDKNLVGARMAKPRLTPAASSEKGTAVGYGQDGAGKLTKGRFQRGSVKVDGVGPKSDFKFAIGNKSYVYKLQSGEFATGESTCYGDSGGPLFDAQGRVFGVTSRGFNDCRNAPSIWTDVAAHATLIESAAIAAGYPLDAAPADAGADAAGSGDGGADSGAGTGTGRDGGADSDSGLASTGEPAKSDGGLSTQDQAEQAVAREESSESNPAAAGCSVTTTRSSSYGTSGALGALFALTLARTLRRRGRNPSTTS